MAEKIKKVDIRFDIGSPAWNHHATGLKCWGEFISVSHQSSQRLKSNSRIQGEAAKEVLPLVSWLPDEFLEDGQWRKRVPTRIPPYCPSCQPDVNTEPTWRKCSDRWRKWVAHVHDYDRR